MIAGVMRLGDRPVRAVMTPRMDIDWIDAAAGHEAIRRQIRASGHARLAVCDGTPEKLVGIVHAKDMLDALIDGRPFDLAALLHQPPVMPDTLATLDALERLRATPLGLAAVHDEYGHFEGIVTAMDILAAIAGDFAAPGDQGPVAAAAPRRTSSTMSGGSSTLPRPPSRHTIRRSHAVSAVRIRTTRPPPSCAGTCSADSTG